MPLNLGPPLTVLMISPSLVCSMAVLKPLTTVDPSARTGDQEKDHRYDLQEPDGAAPLARHVEDHLVGVDPTGNGGISNLLSVLQSLVQLNLLLTWPK